MDLQIYLATSEFVMDTMTSTTQTEYNVFQDRIYILAEPILGHKA